MRDLEYGIRHGDGREQWFGSGTLAEKELKNVWARGDAGEIITRERTKGAARVDHPQQAMAAVLASRDPAVLHNARAELRGEREGDLWLAEARRRASRNVWQDAAAVDALRAEFADVFGACTR